MIPTKPLILLDAQSCVDATDTDWLLKCMAMLQFDFHITLLGTPETIHKVCIIIAASGAPQGFLQFFAVNEWHDSFDVLAIKTKAAGMATIEPYHLW